MKLSRLSNALFYVGIVILQTSCGSGGNEKTAGADFTATADSAAKAQAVSTIVTSPQNMVVVHHKVADYAKWLASYEAHDSAHLPPDYTIMCLAAVSKIPIWSWLS